MAININKGFAYGNINMTPMIDCVFLLLIFFLVATKFEEEEREMNVMLPQASEAMPLTAKPREMVVNVSREGHFVIGGQTITEPQLLGALEQASANNPGRQTVLIRADKRVAWEYVMAVMNCCNKARIRDYRVTAAPETG
ncbi:MAG TPA: biopolymer transporter ExbD [Pirellulales bacterium]|jgi:biopolymer transport protein ExbD|nr:biopolymer transporter ExbD [Pirellulales bacterium]